MLGPSPAAPTAVAMIEAQKSYATLPVSMNAAALRPSATLTVASAGRASRLTTEVGALASDETRNSGSRARSAPALARRSGSSVVLAQASRTCCCSPAAKQEHRAVPSTLSSLVEAVSQRCRPVHSSAESLPTRSLWHQSEHWPVCGSNRAVSKPLWAFRSTEGSNPSPSASEPATRSGGGIAAAVLAAQTRSCAGQRGPARAGLRGFHPATFPQQKSARRAQAVVEHERLQWDGGPPPQLVGLRCEELGRLVEAPS